MKIRPTYSNTVGKWVAIKSLSGVLLVGDKLKLAGVDEPVRIIAVTEKGFTMEDRGFYRWNVRARAVKLIERPAGWTIAKGVPVVEDGVEIERFAP